MEYSEDDYLLLSGIQHYFFCKRQWALIHIEQQWAENLHTVEGEIMHERVHDAAQSEKRGDVITVRAMKISSPALGISGECDAVELHRDPSGVPVFGYEGCFRVVPVEYKKGAPKTDECDIMQLVVQAMCLEYMLGCSINIGYLYYGETRHRLKVEITDEYRSRATEALADMHRMYASGHTPRVKTGRNCRACSLNNICLPVLNTKRSGAEYMRNAFGEWENRNEEAT